MFGIAPRVRSHDQPFSSQENVISDPTRPYEPLTSACATDAFSRGPLSLASRPFIGPISKGSSGSIPDQGPSGKTGDVTTEAVITFPPSQAWTPLQPTIRSRPAQKLAFSFFLSILPTPVSGSCATNSMCFGA